MAKLAIRCHPCAPVTLGEIERWLELLVDELSADLRPRSVRLFRLTQRRPQVDLDVGWLLELELGESQWPPLSERVADALAEMRLLGLQTTLLAPRNVWDGATHGRSRLGAAATSTQPIEETRP